MKYNFPEGDNKERLAVIYDSARQGYLSPYKVMHDSPIFEAAKMLGQLSHADNSISLVVKCIEKHYENGALVALLKETLENKILSLTRRGSITGERKVFRCEPYLQEKYPSVLEGEDGDIITLEAMQIIFKDSEREGVGIPCIIHLYGPSDTISDKLSKEELGYIKEFGDFIKDRRKKLDGNKKESGPTRNPELGRLVLSLMRHFPEDWNDATKNEFLAEFLFSAGYLDFKGEAWLENFKEKDKPEKDREVRNWISSYDEG